MTFDEEAARLPEIQLLASCPTESKRPRVMAMKTGAPAGKPQWAFAVWLRRSAFGWRGSKAVINRINEARRGRIAGSSHRRVTTPVRKRCISMFR